MKFTLIFKIRYRTAKDKVAYFWQKFNSPLQLGFYPRDAMLARVFATATCPSVGPSVRTSVCHTPVLCLAERKQIVKCTPSDSPMTSFWRGMIHRKIRKGSPQRNVPNEDGLGFSAIFDQYVVISRKRCILHTELLWDGNSKPYAIASYRMVSVSMSLSDPWPGFQGDGSFKRRVSPKRRILHTHSYCIGCNRHAIDRQASYTAYNNPTALT